MAEVKLQRITIGFHGQALAARVAGDQLASLRKALEKGADRWHELEAEDGTVVIDLGKVVFVQVDAGDSRVGFGA
ncbi:MAG TPA: hypothetical protein VE972_13685 [Conexibacter sp.]|jgi:hypothetical protein|nr:hypothetical protein [Conexibacter sp.]